MPKDASHVAESTLEECPARTLVFLRGVAQNPTIYRQLAAVGFSADEFQLGWALLHSAVGYQAQESIGPVPKSAAFDAMQELDSWDEDGFRRIRAPLDRLFPEQSAFLFAGNLVASTGPAAVLGVKTLLDRLDALKSSPDRKTTRKEDHTALACLASRGFPQEELDRLRKLVETAQTMDVPSQGPTTMDKAGRDDSLRKLYSWYKDWSETTHSIIKKRAHLITLGLAKRREAAVEPEPPPNN